MKISNILTAIYIIIFNIWTVLNKTKKTLKSNVSVFKKSTNLKNHEFLEDYSNNFEKELKCEDNYVCRELTYFLNYKYNFYLILKDLVCCTNSIIKSKNENFKIEKDYPLIQLNNITLNKENIVQVYKKCLHNYSDLIMIFSDFYDFQKSNSKLSSKSINYCSKNSNINKQNLLSKKETYINEIISYNKLVLDLMLSLPYYFYYDNIEFNDYSANYIIDKKSIFRNENDKHEYNFLEFDKEEINLKGKIIYSPSPIIFEKNDLGFFEGKDDFKYNYLHKINKKYEYTLTISLNDSVNNINKCKAIYTDGYYFLKPKYYYLIESITYFDNDTYITVRCLGSNISISNNNQKQIIYSIYDLKDNEFK